MFVSGSTNQKDPFSFQNSLKLQSFFDGRGRHVFRHVCMHVYEIYVQACA